MTITAIISNLFSWLYVSGAILHVLLYLTVSRDITGVPWVDLSSSLHFLWLERLTGRDYRTSFNAVSDRDRSDWTTPTGICWCLTGPLASFYCVLAGRNKTLWDKLTFQHTEDVRTAAEKTLRPLSRPNKTFAIWKEAFMIYAPASYCFQRLLGTIKSAVNLSSDAEEENTWLVGASMTHEEIFQVL